MTRSRKNALLLMLLSLLPACSEPLQADEQIPESASRESTTMTALPPILVTAQRIPLSWTETGAAADSIAAGTLRESAVRTLPEALNETVGVAVQKTAQGQGSPIIRGFTGFRTLLLVDGIRLNHPAFRDGPNQYWNTVDSTGLDRIEILRGAGSVLYGSDAVGGTVHAFTRTPDYSPDGARRHSGSIHTRLASAERSAMTRLENTVAEGNWALLGGIGIKTFGDLQAGSETGRQRKTGYDEWNLDIKLCLEINPGRELTAAFQHVGQDDIWRTHRTPYGVSWHGTTIGTEKRHVFDQSRSLAYIRFSDAIPTWLYDTLSVTTYWQRQTEDKDVIKKDDTRSLDGFDVQTFGTTIALTQTTPLGLLVYGGEWIHDAVDTYRHNWSADGVQTRAIQGPVGDDAAIDTLGVYAEHRTPVGERWMVTPGGRLTVVHADIGRYEDFSSPARRPASLSQTWTDLSGSIKLSRGMLADESWNLYASLEQSFRAPNLSDLTRFDSARSGDTEIPSPDVDPEHFTTLELGSRMRIGACSWHAAYFYTWIDGLIIRMPTETPHTFTKSNGGDGYVHGFETALTLPLGDHWATRAGFTWMEGYTETDGRTDPIRTQPMTLIAAISRTSADRRLKAELTIKGVAKEDRLTPADQGDTQRIPAGGTPGYGICGIRVNWNVYETLTLGFAIENLLDRDYRTHGSGSNEPGRNVILTAVCQF